ncbi:FAD dependent oxidoreductase [Dactylonectria estremocensis]|uniref:FAD dependent oxidoreductase n=1 Tax=Dactylonectria estremocensis TaxID=1079267 RepID=A0A9P9J5T2_9HYPO|nr:FAD dependent oxidoreductase [Dactylonectria estremocensis]
MAVATLLEEQAELPSTESTKSYWHREPSQTLLGHRTTQDLPAAADIAVVGSGITGTFAARELVNGGRSVLMLEAREACWGATGRNGGHCQPLIYAAQPLISRFELATFRFLRDLVAEHNIPCDWETVGGVHNIPDRETLDLVTKHLDRLKKDFPDLADEAIIVTDQDGLRKLRVREAFAAVYQPSAAKLWPYKLVAWVLERLLFENDSERFNLQTKTPVEHLQRVDDTWVLHTARGQVTAKTVVLATNAYTSSLLPRLSGLLVPVRGQVCALTPPADSTALEHSHVWVAPGGDDYLVQRPTGELILGGERLSVPDGQVGVSRDDTVDPTVGRQLRAAMQHAVKLKPPGDAEEPELEAAYEWTGIMGYSRDGHPWVGRVPARLGGGEGLWISAGYTGHGMPVTARCGIAVAEDILGREGGIDLPVEYRIDAGRAERAHGTVLPTTLIEEIRALIVE